jgi:hypothetical protein
VIAAYLGVEDEESRRSSEVAGEAEVGRMSVAGINVLVDETRAAGRRAAALSVAACKTFYGNIIALKASTST